MPFAENSILILSLGSIIFLCCADIDEDYFECVVQFVTL
jgi:hypothetical protein